MGNFQRARLDSALVELRWRDYARNPAAFFEECLWIPSQETQLGRTRFRMYDHQREDLEVFLGNKFVVVLKGRQIGLSTLVGGLALWRCLFRPGSVILWMSNNQENANKAVQMLNVMWDFMPEWARARAPKREDKNTANAKWRFPDGMTSRIRAYAGTATAGASETASIVVLDEFALVDPHLQDDLLRTADPTTDAGGRLWMISTARGAHNRFAQTFRKARRGESRYVPIFHPWMVSQFINPKSSWIQGCTACGGTALSREHGVCPKCVDTSIYEAKAQEFSEKPWLIHAEYPRTEDEAFRESGNPVLKDLPEEDELEDTWVRGFMREDEDGKAIFVEEPTGALRVRSDMLEGPDLWRDYVIFVDPAEGVGVDYTAAHALTWDDDQLPTIVAWWHANDVKDVDSAREIGMLGLWLNRALLAVETQGGFGGAPLAELNYHLQYPNLYMHTPAEARRRGRATKMGFPMSWQRRPMVVARLVEYMSPDKRVTGIHPLLLQELKTFVQNEKGRMEADVGMHDDLVMSLAGALWVLLEETKPATAPGNDEGQDPAVMQVSLKATRERIEQALRTEQAAHERWARRAGRRAAASDRAASRRKERRERVRA